MVVSEQIDALYSLGRDPVPVLAAPRILAGIVTLPALVGLADAIGFLSGMVSARLTVGLGTETFLYGARLFWHSYDLFYSLMKALAFGFLIPLISVHMGLLTRGGAEGVGRSTTASVVFMIIAILVADAVFPPLFLN
jgi:phospholipid/cholesterol/gamma-HCH transport system permease protein